MEDRAKAGGCGRQEVWRTSKLAEVDAQLRGGSFTHAIWQLNIEQVLRLQRIRMASGTQAYHVAYIQPHLNKH